jgi:hypothetical protein
MADEFEIQNNPDNSPGAVSTGYQRQNTNSEVSRNGIDLSIVTPGTTNGDIDIEISGGVDVNGVMYSCKTLKTLTVSAGVYYIKLTAGSTTDYLTPVLQTGNGSLDASKNARYDSGERILNWILVSSGTAVPVMIGRIIDYGADYISFLKRSVSPGDNYLLKKSGSPLAFENGTTYVLKIDNPEMGFSGRVKVTFTLKEGGGGGTAFARIYKNGSPVGTERSTTSTTLVTYNEDITVDIGDKLQLYMKVSGTTSSITDNFEIKIAQEFVGFTTS